MASKLEIVNDILFYVEQRKKFYETRCYFGRCKFMTVEEYERFLSGMDYYDMFGVALHQFNQAKSKKESVPEAIYRPPTFRLFASKQPKQLLEHWYPSAIKGGFKQMLEAYETGVSVEDIIA